MQKLSPFLRGWLNAALDQWIQAGILRPDQKVQILRQYEPESTGPSVRENLPRILIGLAVLLIGAGLILFYASNWRSMTPAVKLIQVFGVVGLFYGLAFFFLYVMARPLLGRPLLLLGMLAFGAAIGLVAQIYHISAHPTNGVLVWAIGTVLLALVTMERWGGYLGLLIALVWYLWEFAEFNSPAYAFILFPLALLVLFYTLRDTIGLIGVLFATVLYYFLSGAYVADRLTTDAGWIILVLGAAPLGIILTLAPRFAAREVRIAAGLTALAGRVLVFVPFIGLSWPLGFDVRFLWNDANVLPLALVFGALCVAACGLVAFAYRTRGVGDELFLAGLVLVALVHAVLPLGLKSVLLVATHLGLVGLLLGGLYYAYRGSVPAVEPGGTIRSFERVGFVVFALITLVIKGTGLYGLGTENEPYYVAYSVGFLILGNVLYLMTEIAGHLAARDGGREYPRSFLSFFHAAAIFLVMYGVSFRAPAQASIFQADPVVLALLALFIVLGLLFFAALYAAGSERLPLGLSGLVFLSSIFVLLIARPEVPWYVYSLLFNLLLFLLGGVLIYYSTRINSPLLANAALAGLVLQIVTRYFDVFWDLLSGSALFLVTGVLLFGGGYILERNRRRLLDSMQGGDRPEVRQ